MEAEIEDLLGRMSVEEKVSLVAGVDLWRTRAIPRLGIPAVKMTDGPSGARGGSFTGGPTAACFPCGAALGATWSPELVRRVGAALAEEARSKGAHVLLGPTVNMHRSPLGGRHFECYSEDPHLAARIAVGFVAGVQSRGVSACVKHFACNDSEFERMSQSSEVGERALREIYLPPFEAAVREAGAWCVMAAYNRVNGTYASEHPFLLRDLLKGEWGFDGVVVSDWGGTRSTAAAANAGLDLEMPGPPRYMGEPLLAAVRAGQVDEKTIDDKVRRILRLALRTGAFREPDEPPEVADDRPAHRALAREAATEACVLLRNEGGLLPLDPERIRSLAVIGPNAGVAEIQGGGSARVPPHYAVTPLEGLVARLGAERVRFEPGCTSHRTTPVLDGRLVRPAAGGAARGLTTEYFPNDELAGEPVLTTLSREAAFFWVGPAAPGLDPEHFSVRASAILLPPETGAYAFGLASAGRSRLLLDGRLVIDDWTRPATAGAFLGVGSEATAVLPLEAGRPVELRIEYSRAGAPFVGGLKAGCLPPFPPDAMERAVAAAAAADAAVVVVGLGAEWETEGRDRADLELPGRQAELVTRVAAANPRTVVVVNAGAPVRMDWTGRVPALLWLWYPGQECGNALADVLLGDRDPGGRLPTTFPRRIEDTPSYLDYPGENGAVQYGEGIFAGYRGYDRRKIEPLFPFGHGLSYADFTYGELRLAPAEVGPSDLFEAAVDVTNRGARAGMEVVQLYVHVPVSRLARPEQELRAFAKVSLAPGEARSVRFRLDAQALSCWDPARHGWVAEPGELELRVGRSSRDLRARARLVLRGS